jgi:hypothetical protein
MTFKDNGKDATHLYQPNDFIALELGQLAAQRVTPQSLEQFRKDLQKMREKSRDSAYFRAWDTIIENGPEAVQRALIEPSERGQVLRSVISFRTFVSRDEREDIVRKHARAQSRGR